MESNRVLTVHWKEHNQQLSQGLWDLFNREYMVDTNVSFCGEVIKVHSLLLTVFLPAFGKMNSKKTVKDLNLDEMANQKDDVQSLVEFIYTGKTTIAEDRIEYIRSLARNLDFKGFASSIDECGQSDTDGNDLKDNSCFGLVQENKSPQVAKSLDTNGSSKLEENNVEALSQDIASVKCRLSLRKLDKYKSRRNVVSATRKTKNAKRKPIKHKSVQREKDKLINSELIVAFNSRTRSQSTAFRHNKKLKNYSAEETENVTTVSSEREDLDEYCDGKDRRRFERKTSTIPMKCGNCDYESNTRLDLNRHIKQHEPERLKCDKCDKEFKSKRSFLLHKNTSCGLDLQFVCNHCGHQTLRQSTLEEHLAAKHKVDLKGKPLEENVKCTKCDFVCYARHQLKYHVLRKHTEKKFECSQCEFAAVVKSELKKHFSIRHLNEKNFVCDECGARFQTRGSLNVHIRTKHKGMKEYKCNMCDKEYVSHTSYKIHMSKHTGTEKLFVCHVCGHSCNKRYNLGTHMVRKHGLKIEPVKKDYAPRQKTTNHAENASSNVAVEEVTSCNNGT